MPTEMRTPLGAAFACLAVSLAVATGDVGAQAASGGARPAPGGPAMIPPIAPTSPSGAAALGAQGGTVQGSTGQGIPPAPMTAPHAAPATPLPAVSGAVPWELLARVKPVKVRDRFVAEFDPEVRALHQKDVRIVGFMMPLQPGERQTHFLLTVTPQTCAFCLPAGPEGVVEVRTKVPVKVTFEPIVVAGRLDVLRDDPTGVYYRIGNAQPVAR